MEAFSSGVDFTVVTLDPREGIATSDDFNYQESTTDIGFKFACVRCVQQGQQCNGSNGLAMAEGSLSNHLHNFNPTTRGLGSLTTPTYFSRAALVVPHLPQQLWQKASLKLEKQKATLKEELRRENFATAFSAESES